MPWPKTPKELRFHAIIWTGDGWTEQREFVDLRKGDVFKTIAPQGHFISLRDEEPNDEAVALALGDPIPNDILGHGYSLPVEVGTLEDMLRLRAN